MSHESSPNGRAAASTINPLIGVFTDDTLDNVCCAVSDIGYVLPQVDNPPDGSELRFGSLHLFCGVISAALKYERNNPSLSAAGNRGAEPADLSRRDLRAESAPARRMEDLIAASVDAFGQHPEDVLGPAKMAAKGFGWLNEILVSIQREAEGEKFSPRIVKLASAGAYLAVDLENYCSSERESMLQKLQEVGILPPDRGPID